MEMHTAQSLMSVHGITTSPRPRRYGSFLAWAAATLRAIVEDMRSWQRHQQAVEQLSRLDDRMLADIGLSRSDIEFAARTGRRRPLFDA